MFGSSRPVVFDPYRGRGQRRRFPRWLLLLLCGLAGGSAGVLYLQERYLPPRLSVTESAQLKESFDKAEAERLRLQNELGSTSQRLQSALSERAALAQGAAVSRTLTERLADDLAFAVQALPPDPRDGQVAVRAARLSAQGGSLDYSVALTHARRGGKLNGVLQVVVTGTAAAGGEQSVTLQPVQLALSGQTVLRGSLALPEGFTPRQATLRVLERSGGGQLGMRVLNVN